MITALLFAGHINFSSLSEMDKTIPPEPEKIYYGVVQSSIYPYSEVRLWNPIDQNWVLVLWAKDLRGL